VVWEAARRDVPVSTETEEAMRRNVHLAGESFRSSDLVRRFFLAICGRPLQAGKALRFAAQVGLLQRYIPEFEAVQNIVRYEDFHHYPVDEHTLRAVEALARIPELEGSVGEFLQVALEHLSDPHILVLSLLFHDLGKVEGEEHSVAGMKIAQEISERMGLPSEDSERIAFLVEHHLLMTHNALYRDTDDPDVIERFAATMKSDHRLRTLFLLSYADMSAVGPNVWNDWKGTLLVKLYLRAERVLTGRSAPQSDEIASHPKAKTVTELSGPALASQAADLIRELGEQYFEAFPAEQIAEHVRCRAEAKRDGRAVRVMPSPGTGTVEVVVCTQDRPGLIQEIAACMAAEMADIERAAMYTLEDGFALDSFAVVSARRRTALTENEAAALAKSILRVLKGQTSLEDLVAKSRQRLFAFTHRPVPTQTEVRFDNASSKTHTVIDMITADRTGLLHDVAAAMTAAGLDIASARIVTDARRVRDSFYVARDGGKIEESAVIDRVRANIEDAIYMRANSEV
jgi:[protein-PII] uridylyltransferase